MCIRDRKVKCKKIGDRYVFTIDLTLTGEIIENDMYEGLDKDLKVLKKLEEDLALKLKEMCHEFINKMQQEYGRDFLELGWVGAVSYTHLRQGYTKSSHVSAKRGAQG